MRRKINGEAYLIIKKNYTLIIRNSNSDPKITLLIEPTTITSYKFSFFLLRLSKHNFYPDQSSVSQRLLSSQKLLNRTISKSLFPTKTPYQMIIYKPCSRFFISLLITSDSGVVTGISFNDLKLFTIGFCSGKNDNV